MPYLFSYLLESSICLVLFYLLYHFLLRNETAFQWSRAYLLLSSCLVLIVPLLHIEVESGSFFLFEEVTKNTVFEGFEDFEVLQKEPVAVSQETAIAPKAVEVTSSFSEEKKASWSIIGLIKYGYFLGCLFFAGVLLLQLWRVRRLVKSGNLLSNENGVCLLELEKEMPVCSFGKYIFWSKSLTYSDSEKEQILQHESIHVLQKHTFDLLWLEGLRIVFWFHPFMYAYLRSIREVHEFIADRGVVLQSQKPFEYGKLLLEQVQNPTYGYSIKAYFNHLGVKKRLLMMTRGRTNQWRILVLFCLMGLLSGFMIVGNGAERIRFESETIYKTWTTNDPINFDKEGNRRSEEAVLAELARITTLSSGKKYGQDVVKLVDNDLLLTSLPYQHQPHDSYGVTLHTMARSLTASAHEKEVRTEPSRAAYVHDFVEVRNAQGDLQEVAAYRVSLVESKENLNDRYDYNLFAKEKTSIAHVIIEDVPYNYHITTFDSEIGCNDLFLSAAPSLVGADSKANFDEMTVEKGSGGVSIAGMYQNALPLLIEGYSKAYIDEIVVVKEGVEIAIEGVYEFVLKK